MSHINPSQIAIGRPWTSVLYVYDTTVVDDQFIINYLFMGFVLNRKNILTKLLIQPTKE